MKKRFSSLKLSLIFVFSLFLVVGMSGSVLGANNLILETPVGGNFYSGDLLTSWFYDGTPQGPIRISYNDYNDGSGWTFLEQVPEGSTSYSWNTDGKNGDYQIYIYERETGIDDLSGVFTIDNIDPSSSASVVDYQNSLTFDVLFTVNDANPDYVELWYRYDTGSSWTAWTKYEELFSISPISFTTTEDGTFEFYTIAVDKVGNVESTPGVADDSTTVDTVKPSTTDDYTVTGWQTSDQTITLTPTDNSPSSEIEWTRYCINTINTCDPASGIDYSASVLISTEGTNYFRYASKDNAGNVQDTISKTVMIDKTNPTADVSGAPAGLIVDKNGVNAEVTCLDSESDCDGLSYKYKVDATEQVECSTNLGEYTDYTTSVLITGHSWVCSYVKDNAGIEDFSDPVEFNIFSTITDAITATVPEDNTIYVNSDTYDESILIGESLTLIGVGNPKPVITGVAENNYIIKVTADNVVIDNIEVNGGGSGTGENTFTYGISVSNSNIVEIKNSDITNIWQAGSNGIDVTSSQNVVIHDNTLTHVHKRYVRYTNSNGILHTNVITGDNVDGTTRVQNLVNLWGGSNVEIYGNTLYNALSPGGTRTWDSPGIFVTSYGGSGDSYANIYDNEIYNCDSGIVVGSVYATTDSSSATITNNSLHNLENAIIFEVERKNGGLNTVSAVISGNTFTNNENDFYHVLNIEGTNNYYGGIQQTIDIASAENTIDVSAGTYEEFITINKPLDLQGSGVSNTIIDMSGSGDPSVRKQVMTVSLSSSGNVIIDGFEINLGENMDAIELDSGDSSSVVTISNNKITGYGEDKCNDLKDFGIYAHDNAAKVVINNNEINTNCNPILLERLSGESDIFSNVLYGKDNSAGIFIMTLYDVDVTALQNIYDNTITLLEVGSAGGIGIRTSPLWTVASDGKFTDVEITDNTITGIDSENNYGIKILNDRNDGTPENSKISGVTISGNTITGSGGTGIILGGLVENTNINYNRISGVNKGIRIDKGSTTSYYPTGTIVNKNSIINCITKGLSWLGSETLNAENNWWGDLDPSDNVVGKVDYTPWAYGDGLYDEIAPTTVIDSPAESSWHKEAFNVGLTDLDTGGAGLATCYYRVRSNGEATKIKSSRDCSVTKLLLIGADSENYCETEGKDACKIEVWATDNSGNGDDESTKVERTFSIDWTNPTGSILIKNGEPYANNVNVQLNLIYSDILDNNLDCRYSNDGSSWGVWETCTSTKIWTLTPGDDSKTVYYEIKDDAGNVAPFSDSIILDTQAPIISDITPGNITTSVGEPVTVTARVTDIGGSGVDIVNLIYKVDGGTPVTVPMNDVGDIYSEEIPGQSSKGEVTYYIEAKDVAVNTITSSPSNTVTIKDLTWDLASNWNLVSVPKTLTTNSKVGLLGNIVWEYDALTGTWEKNPTTIDPGVGYWVDNSPLTELGLDYAEDCSGGEGCMPSGTINIDALQPGWNLIGLTSTETKTVGEAFKSDIYEDNLPVFYVIKYNEPIGEVEGGFESLIKTDTLYPGIGYWIYLDE